MSTFDIASITQALHAARREWREAQSRSQEPGGRELPSRDALAKIIEQLKEALFPMRLGPLDLRQESEDFFVAHRLDAVLHALLGQVLLELRYSRRHNPSSNGDFASRCAGGYTQFCPILAGHPPSVG